MKAIVYIFSAKIDIKFLNNKHLTSLTSLHKQSENSLIQIQRKSPKIYKQAAKRKKHSIQVFSAGSKRSALFSIFGQIE